MRCEINLNWRNADETLSLSRNKDQEDVWTAPGQGDTRVIPQIIGVLDATYADIRAALIAALPKETQGHVSVVVKMTPEQAADFMRGMDVSRGSQ